MIRTLLVPLDGSPQSEQALPYAARLARQTGAGLLLVRSYGRDPGELPSTTEAKAGVAHTYLEAHRLRLMDEGLTVGIQVLDSDPVRAITGVARRLCVDLIVMSTHGHSGLCHLFLGSVAKAVLRQTPMPVLLVRAGRAPLAAPAGPNRKILVPLDGTPFAETALTYLLEMGCDPQEIVLLCAVSLGAYSKLEGIPGIIEPADSTRIQAGPGREQTMAQRYLDRVNRRYLTGRAAVIDLPIGGAGQAIAEAAHGEGVEFIVMATHDRRGLDRLVHASVTHYVLHHAPVPVLLLPGAMRQATQVERQAKRVADNRVPALLA